MHTEGPQVLIELLQEDFFFFFNDDDDRVFPLWFGQD